MNVLSIDLILQGTNGRVYLLPIDTYVVAFLLASIWIGTRARLMYVRA